MPCAICKIHKADYCIQCNANFCNNCWSTQLNHLDDGADGERHEKGRYADVVMIKGILDIATKNDLQKMHESDACTNWFGVGQDGERPVFQEYWRYRDVIMAGTLEKATGERFPQLVSFVGQTGAGKSTLVKLLVDFIGYQSDQSKFPSPVPGSPNDNIPTSGGVHLYADPKSHTDKCPILYADCEGLEGGEAIPYGDRLRNRTHHIPSDDGGTNTSPQKDSQGIYWKNRPIRWADEQSNSKREFIVTQLYPRLLYTFSDVIVFVLRNARTFESAVLQNLLHWPHSSIETSVNQFALPHIIIVLNAVDNNTNDADQWDVKSTTDRFLADFENVLDNNEKFHRYKKFWVDRGKTINSLKEILELFYSSVTVIRIPQGRAYARLQTQTIELYRRIEKCTWDAYYRRLSVRLLSNADDLDVYLNCAFDHFTTTLDKPFNFVEVSLKNNPMSFDFEGNILWLARRIIDKCGDNDREDKLLKLSEMVASCIFLDIARRKSKGPLIDLYEKQYQSHCDLAIERLFSLNWPCEFRGKGNRKCIAIKAGHTKGHQDINGKIIGSSAYMSNIDSKDLSQKWHTSLRRQLNEKAKESEEALLSYSGTTEKKIAESSHLKKVRPFYKAVGGASEFQSHAICLCCLRELPEHPLPCGHVLCAPCINSYGTRGDDEWTSISICPLDEQDMHGEGRWPIPTVPLLAGIRVLSLDGGGIRGIVEIEILAEIEKELGGNIPIQDFIDLIVGTSIGGIIGLGLGVKKWPVKRLQERFIKLCGTAFTPRSLHRIPVLRNIVNYSKGSIYRSSPFEKTLREELGEERIFGGHHKKDTYTCHTAAVSTTGTGSHATLLSNYNRQGLEEHQETYHFERNADTKDELKIWEVARATSAAPPFFTRFKTSVGRGYLDGAFYHNNPVRIAAQERKLIWPRTKPYHPDILISLGTGYKSTIDTSLQYPSRDPDQQGNHRNKEILPETKIVDVMKNRVTSMLDCDHAWKEFVRDIVGAQTADDVFRRYQRLDIDLDDYPRLDEKEKIGRLQAVVRDKLKEPAEIQKIRLIARQLIASSFYVEKFLPVIKDEVGKRHFVGFICCRFHKGSVNLRELGKFLQLEQTAQFQPYFKTTPERSVKPEKVPITREIIGNMVDVAQFQPTKIVILEAEGALTNIELCFRGGEILPISGFPRNVTNDDELLKLDSPGLINHRRSAEGLQGAKDDIEISRLLHSPRVRPTISNPNLRITHRRSCE